MNEIGEELGALGYLKKGESPSNSHFAKNKSNSEVVIVYGPKDYGDILSFYNIDDVNDIKFIEGLHKGYSLLSIRPCKEVDSLQGPVKID